MADGTTVLLLLNRADNATRDITAPFADCLMHGSAGSRIAVAPPCPSPPESVLANRSRVFVFTRLLDWVKTHIEEAMPSFRFVSISDCWLSGGGCVERHIIRDAQRELHRQCGATTRLCLCTPEAGGSVGGGSAPLR
eukprot:COSAG06_NODE_71_length_25945_cov_9.124468_20_plen_137_part_00